MVYYLWTYCDIKSIHNALLFSELMFLVVPITFPWLSENARSFHLQKANISLRSQQVRNDVSLRSLKKIVVYFYCIQLISVMLQSSATNFFFFSLCHLLGVRDGGVTLQLQQVVDSRLDDRRKWLFIKKNPNILHH